MKPHVQAALDAQLTRRPSVPDYDHLRLSRGVLHTPDGDVPVKQIEKGAFSTVYREQGGAGRVFAVSSDETYDKEIASHARVESNPHVPAVERFGSTADKAVYVMPYYRTPLRKGDSAEAREAWLDYTSLKKCHDEAHAERMVAGKYDPHDLGYPVNTDTVLCAKRRYVKPAVTEALESLMSTAANYSTTYAFEFAPRNLATDDAGNLVLLDVLFDQEAMAKLRFRRLTDSLRRRRMREHGY